MSQDRVRVLRLIEYEGDRDLVEEQIESSLHGTRVVVRAHREPIRITAVTLGTYPEIIEPARAVVMPKALEEASRTINSLLAENKRLRSVLDKIE